jgi:hypothetical protein
MGQEVSMLAIDGKSGAQVQAVALTAGQDVTDVRRSSAQSAKSRVSLPKCA